MSAGERQDSGSRDAPTDARETRRRYSADEVSRCGRWMQCAGGVELFPEARDERMRRLPSSRGCHARLCFGPKPSGTFESETITAGLAPDGVYVYAEWGVGRRNRPLSQGEHGCPKQSRTMSGKPRRSTISSQHITRSHNPHVRGNMVQYSNIRFR